LFKYDSKYINEKAWKKAATALEAQLKVSTALWDNTLAGMSLFSVI
jgi:hypothetical protein